MIVDSAQYGIGLIQPYKTTCRVQQESAKSAASDEIKSGTCKPSLIHKRPLCEQQRQGKHREHDGDDKDEPIGRQIPPVNS